MTSSFLSQGLFNWVSQAKGGEEEKSSGRNPKENTGRTDPSQRRSKWEVMLCAEVKVTSTVKMTSSSVCLLYFQRHKEYVKMLKERQEALGEMNTGSLLLLLQQHLHTLVLLIAFVSRPTLQRRTKMIWRTR